jgi:predicted enzyme related to lactoylglutathione lyase
VLGRPTSVMAFTHEPEKAARWWGQLLDTPVQTDRNGERVYAWITVDGVELGFHYDDGHNQIGGSPVVYWTVTDLDTVRARFLEAGATHHRGPLQIAPGRRVCQLQDPFGLFVGLEGP